MIVGSYNGYIHFYNAQGQELAGDNDGGEYGGDYIRYELPEDGKYYVRVRSYDRVGNYEVTVVVARGMDLESDREYANDEAQAGRANAVELGGRGECADSEGGRDRWCFGRAVTGMSITTSWGC